MKRIKVLLLSTDFPTYPDEPRGTIIYRFSLWMKKKGCDIVVIAPHRPFSPLVYNISSINVIRFPFFFPLEKETLTSGSGIFFEFKKNISNKIQLFFLLIAEWVMVTLLIIKERPDIIHSQWIIPHGLIGGILGYLFRIPHITSLHGTDITIAFKNPIFLITIKIASFFSSIITANSSYTLQLMSQLSKKGDKGVIRIPMGFDSNIFKSYELNKDVVNNKEKEVIILFVGRLIPWKGIQTLIKSYTYILKYNINAQLIIIGSGPIKEELETEIRWKNLNSIRFIDYLPIQELYDWYQKADIFVLPSININGETEGLGLVLLEAMASGVPVIGSNTGGIPDIIEDGVNGLLVPPGDPEALADAIVRILENPEIADRFREAGLKTVHERFSWDTITDQFVGVYNEVLKRKRDDIDVNPRL